MDTLETGELDYENLRHHLMTNKDKPAVLNLNIGTTVKGAVDDVDKARAFCPPPPPAAAARRRRPLSPEATVLFLTSGGAASNFRPD